VCMEKAVVDAQVLFYFHYSYAKVPRLLQELKKRVITGKTTAIIPVVAIAELYYKLRKRNDTDTDEDVENRIAKLKIAVDRWKKSDHVIIDSFDTQIMELMLQNTQRHEIFDEIIAMCCKRHGTNIIYATDKKFKEIFKLELRSWR
jgi:predicted nucleic acid-binding protein